MAVDVARVREPARGRVVSAWLLSLAWWQLALVGAATPGLVVRGQPRRTYRLAALPDGECACADGTGCAVAS